MVYSKNQGDFHDKGPDKSCALKEFGAPEENSLFGLEIESRTQSICFFDLGNRSSGPDVHDEGPSTKIWCTP